MDGAERREVLEAHLRRAVLADRDPVCEPQSQMFARLTAAMRTKS
ncbi:MAG TPA: hypothetical protein VE644_09605 [Gaiellaceae bacterium]|nr:hypothetical protein [Gaiellaceae bacterium]